MGIIHPCLTLAFTAAQQEPPLQYRIDIIIKLQIKRCFVDKDYLPELSVTATQKSHPAYCLLKWIHSAVWKVEYLFYFAKC